jgi:hypothetical protein
MLDNYGYRHTLRICNTYCFSTATMVTRTRFSVTFIRTVPFFFFLLFGHACTVSDRNLLFSPSGCCVYRQVSQSKRLHSAHRVYFFYFFYISQQTTMIFLYIINWLILITGTQFVYCAVRTECWNTILGHFYRQSFNGRKTVVFIHSCLFHSTVPVGVGMWINLFKLCFKSQLAFSITIVIVRRGYFYR